MRSVLSIQPTTNAALASPTEREDAMLGIGRMLMGLSHNLQLVSQARPVAGTWDWSKPPQIERRWLAVIADKSPDTLAWQTRTLKSSLEGVGFRCAELEGGGQHDSVQPGAVVTGALTVERDCVRQGFLFSASLVLRRWPREVAPGWLGQALSGDQPVDVAIHVQPQDAQRIARFLKKQSAWQDDGGKDAGNQLGRTDAEKVREKLIAHTDKPVKVAVVFTVRAETRAQLRQNVSTLTHEIGLSLGDVRPVTFEHDRGLEATEPNGVCNLLGAWRTLDCTSVASTGIFQPVSVNHPDGVDIGVTGRGGMLVRLDPFDASLEGFSGIVVGKKRMGKSYFMKVLARGLAARGVEVTIIEQLDPPEYAVLAHLPNITVVNIEEVAKDEEDADLQVEQRVAFLRKFTSDLWDRARKDPKPRLLIVDEAWSLLRAAKSAAWIETVARTGGHFGLSLWILTQQVRELLATGRAALDNAEIRIFLKQHDEDLDDICDAVGLKTASGASHPAKRYLRGATRGQILLGVGDVWIEVDVARVAEHYEISTDPRDVWNHAAERVPA